MPSTLQCRFLLLILPLLIVTKQIYCQGSGGGCEIPPGKFEGMVASSSIPEPFYGTYTEEVSTPFQRFVWMCIPYYCTNAPCTCTSNDKKDSNTENTTFSTVCFENMKKASTMKRVCAPGFKEDELHVCRNFSCSVSNGGCDQQCNKNATTNEEYCACDLGYQRMFNGIVGSCVKIDCNIANGYCENQLCLRNVSYNYCGCQPGSKMLLIDGVKSCEVPSTPKPIVINNNSAGGSSTSSTELFTHVFPWQYILAIVLAIFLCFIICLILLIVFACKRNKSTDTRVEKTTVVHYEKTAPSISEAPRIYVVPTRDANYDRKKKIKSSSDDEDREGEYDGVRNLKALTTSPPSILDNSYGGEMHDHLAYEGINPTYDIDASKYVQDKLKVYNIDDDGQRRSRKGSVSTTDDTDTYGRKPGCHKQVSVTYSSGPGPSDAGYKRSRSQSESVEGKGKGSSKNKNHGIEDVSGNYGNYGDKASGKGSGKGSGKSKSSAYDESQGKNKGSGSKNKSTVYSNSSVDIYTNGGEIGKVSGKGKYSGTNDDQYGDTIEDEKKKAQLKHGSEKLRDRSTSNASQPRNGKKEKSTDCDSALIPLRCVHG